MKKMLVRDKKYKVSQSKRKASNEIKRIISLNVNIGEYEILKETIIKKAINKENAYICFANVHMTVEAKQNNHLAKGINEAYCVFPDGMPLIWALRLFYSIKQERITGMDMMPEMLKAAENYQLPVYFIGSTEQMLNQVVKVCEKKYPKAKIAGTFSPPFRELSEEEEASIVEKIRKSGASIVFVALGCPKQEMFMSRLSSKVNAVMLGIGGALPVFAGEIGRAPLWMQNNGLEWLYRFLQEPKRLFKRYAVTNSLFVLYILEQLIKGEYKHASPDSTVRI